MSETRIVQHRRGLRPIRLPGSLAVYIVLAIAIVAIWLLVTASGVADPLVIAPPGKVISEAGSSWRPALDQLRTTAGRVLLAMGLVWLGGLLIGSVLASSQRFDPLVRLVRSGYAIPIIIVYPILSIWFGYGTTGKVVFGFLGGIVPMTLGVVASLKSVDRGVRLLFSSLGASFWERAWKGYIPACLPGVLGAMRLSASLTLVYVVAGEVLTSDSGIGYFIAQAEGSYDTPNVYFGIILVICLAIILHLLLSAFERLLARVRGGRL